MKYINATPNPGGSYPPPQSVEEPGLLALTNEQADMVIQYNGFVIISQDDAGDTVVGPNIEAWEAWKATIPPEPEPETPISWDAMAAAIREGVNEV